MRQTSLDIERIKRIIRVCFASLVVGLNIFVGVLLVSLSEGVPSSHKWPLPLPFLLAAIFALEIRVAFTQREQGQGNLTSVARISLVQHILFIPVSVWALIWLIVSAHHALAFCVLIAIGRLVHDIWKIYRCLLASPGDTR